MKTFRIWFTDGSACIRRGENEAAVRETVKDEIRDGKLANPQDWSMRPLKIKKLEDISI